MVDDTRGHDVRNCTDEQIKTGRRGALKSIGLGIAGVSGISQLGLTDDYVEITTEIGRDENATESVPKEWYEYEERVDEALHVAREKYKSMDDIQGVSIVPSDQTRGGKRVNKLEISVASASLNTQAISLPDEVNQIPTTTAEATNLIPALGGCYNDGDYYGLKGGQTVSTDYLNGGYGTSCCRVTKNGAEYILTANHLFGDCDGSGNWGENLYNQERVGEVFQYNDTMDWVLVDRSGGQPYRDYIDSSARGDLQVASHFTRSGLKNLMSSNTTVYKQGCSSGRKTGQIRKINGDWGNGCIQLGGDGVTVSNNIISGDSGGPIYADSSLSYGDVSIISLTVARPDSMSRLKKKCNKWVYGRTASSPAYLMHENHGIDFY